MEERRFSIFLRGLSADNKKKLRKYEDSCRRLIDATQAIIFNENCIREKLCPKSIYIYIQGWALSTFNVLKY